MHAITELNIMELFSFVYCLPYTKNTARENKNNFWKMNYEHNSRPCPSAVRIRDDNKMVVVHGLS